MISLPLYKDGTPPLGAVELETPLARDPQCSRCPLPTLSKPRTVCVPPEGEVGGLLIVGESPGRNEDLVGRPFVGESGKLLRPLVQKFWSGPVAIDNAVRCFPGREGVKDEHADQCRAYLAKTVRDVKPTRIVALGAWAAYSLLGRSVQMLSTRKGYGWLTSVHDTRERRDDATFVHDGPPVPVFFVLHPAAALRNRFIRGWFEEDLQWALTSPIPETPPWTGYAQIVTSREDALEVQANLRRAKWAVLDVETAGRMHDATFTLLCLSFAVPGFDSAWVWDAPALQNPETRDVLVDILDDESIMKVGQSFKYDTNSVKAALGATVRGVYGDTRLWRKILDPEADAKLATMAELVGMGGHKEEARKAQEDGKKRIRKALKGSQPIPELPPEVEAVLRLGADMDDYKFAFMPTDVLHRYNAMDSISTARLGVKLETELRASPLARVWDTIVKDAERAVAQVEEWGFLVDEDAIRAFDRYLGTHLDEIKTRFDKAGLTDFNPNSTPQVAKLLYETLKLKPPKLTDTGKPSTDSEALELLKQVHPIAADIQDWREYQKLKGTYAEGMMYHIRGDGRVHSSLNLDGARSGRLSSSDPNMQNIPSPTTPMGKMSRDCFVAPTGRVLIQADYSQLELRVAAMLSGDPAMTQIFIDGLDYHQRTAEMVSLQAWGIQPSSVTPHHRKAAKIINFRCVSMDTKILTKRGWLSHDEVRTGDWTPGRTGWTQVRQVVRYDSAPLVAWQGFRVTPNHRWWSRRRTGDNKSGRYFVEEFTTLETVTTEHSITLSRPQPGGLGCGLSPDQCAVLAWIVTDGCATDRNVRINQSYRVNPDKLAEIEDLLLRAGVPFKRYDRPTGIADVCLRDPKGRWRHLAKMLKTDQEAGEAFVLRMTAEERAAFVRASLLAEGHQKMGRWYWTQNRGPLAEVFRLAFFLEGYFVRTYPDRKTVKLNLSKPYITGQRLRTDNAGFGSVWCVRTDDETWTMRRGDSIAITGNTLYGGGDAANAKEIGCTTAEAARVREAIFGKFTKLASFIQSCRNRALKTGFAWTWWDGQDFRRRSLYRVADPDDEMRSVHEHASWNTPIQGTASDFCLASLVEVVRWVKDDCVPARVVMTVHDSIILEVDQSAVRETYEQVRRIMQSWPSNGVPLVADLEIGHAWGSMEELAFCEHCDRREIATKDGQFCCSARESVFRLNGK